jgi:dihydrofolate synthase/folylpolyglutamate synthase
MASAMRRRRAASKKQALSEARLTFAEAEAALAAFQTRGWRLGLDRMQAYLREIGLADYAWGRERPQYFHAAGSNGKGSVTCFLQALLHAHGFKVGACYSPFVHTVRERAQIGLDLISEEEFARLTVRLLEAGKRLEPTEFGGPTEFEMKTALGFLAWAEAGCDAVAVETGLGGRLDATNVLEPAVSLITSISLDHTQHLGETLAEIAGEKAGIIKPGRPVVMGALPPEAAAVIEARAHALDCPIWRLGHEFERWDGPLAMPGPWQTGNAAVALAGLHAAGIEVDMQKAAQALAEARLPGRCERRVTPSGEALLDGAHNVESAQLLADWLAGQPGWSEGYVLAWSGLNGHDSEAVVRHLAQGAKEIRVFPLDDPRAVPIDALEAAARATGKPVKVYGSTAEAVREPADRLLAAGSFVLVCEAGRALSL